MFTEKFPLHKAVFLNDIYKLEKLIKNGSDLKEKDVHENTALHLAIILGHRKAIDLLLANGGINTTKNAQGWRCIGEAISYGDREIIKSVLKKMEEEDKKDNQKLGHKETGKEVLMDIGDFFLEIKWDFKSWVPLVSMALPSDVCKIYKQGLSFRVDTTVTEAKELLWNRGDISFVYNHDKPSASRTYVMDHKQKVFQMVDKKEDDKDKNKNKPDTDKVVDMLMSMDIVSAKMSTKSLNFEPVYSGWISREEKVDKVGEYLAKFYTMEGMALITKKRREHLTEEDIVANKNFKRALDYTKAMANEKTKDIPHRPSLPPPEKTHVTWEEYINSPEGEYPDLGRRQIMKNNTFKIPKTTVAMSEEFPLTLEDFVDVLEKLAPLPQFNRLRKFLSVKLPPGFPVQFAIEKTLIGFQAWIKRKQ